MDNKELREKLAGAKLKVTPQRLAVLEAVSILNGHPTADRIIQHVRKSNPNISAATVYNILEVLSQNGIISKVKHEKDIMRYDAVTKTHHHLYGIESDKIEDYFDEEIDEILKNYFGKKNIPGFEIQDIRLNIHGEFKKRK